MAFNWVAAVVVYLFYPETQGCTLERVHELFDDISLGPSSDPYSASAVSEKAHQPVVVKEAISTVNGLTSLSNADAMYPARGILTRGIGHKVAGIRTSEQT